MAGRRTTTEDSSCTLLHPHLFVELLPIPDSNTVIFESCGQGEVVPIASSESRFLISSIRGLICSIQLHDALLLNLTGSF